MYITKAIVDGLKIIGFETQTIKRLAREKSLEEIFLSNLFLNYLIVLVIYMLGLIQGNFLIEGREINMPILFAFLMVYPFIFNLIVYLIYGLFGFVAEMVDSKNHIKPLLSVGFHTSIVYTIIIYVIGLIATFHLTYALFLFLMFVTLFIIVMFRVLSVVYNFSLHQVLIVLFVPFLLLGVLGLVLNLFFPGILSNTIINLF